ncbi:hypothetical protein, partial [Akkermansia muciniphila]|uniref:hypothetical protein n=1 Tax=Akkermansia muciniphila TaxID=239935 RepID=UPI00164ABDC6
DLFGSHSRECAQLAPDFDAEPFDAGGIAIGEFPDEILRKPIENQHAVPDKMVIGQSIERELVQVLVFFGRRI